ncbi:MAG: response regulator, partial [Dehalococcoidia bacterium]|nr:response regulator [Dehalococcoidia bacterium]
WIPEREMGQTDAAGDGSKWVLVVDDEPSLRKVAKRLVEALGHHCDVASTVEEATALAAECDYDLVLCDYRLATDVADDVVEGLQRVAPQLVSRIVIATGATTDAGLGTLARRYGIQVLPKPYGIEEISNLLRVAEEAA